MPKQFITVKNLEKYHPGYKDRSLQWCKTYFSMLNSDPAFEMIPEIDKWRYVAFVMLELQIKKPLPLDEQWLDRKGFDIKTRPISETIQMLHNFISIVTEDPKQRNESVTQSRVEYSRVDKDPTPSADSHKTSKSEPLSKSQKSFLKNLLSDKMKYSRGSEATDIEFDLLVEACQKNGGQDIFAYLKTAISNIGEPYKR